MTILYKDLPVDCLYRCKWRPPLCTQYRLPTYLKISQSNKPFFSCLFAAVFLCLFIITSQNALCHIFLPRCPKQQGTPLPIPLRLCNDDCVEITTGQCAPEWTYASTQSVASGSQISFPVVDCASLPQSKNIVSQYQCSPLRISCKFAFNGWLFVLWNWVS